MGVLAQYADLPQDNPRKIPLGPLQIDGHHPLARGLRAYFLTGHPQFDIVGLTPRPTWTSCSIEQTAIGPSAYFNNAGNISIPDCAAVGSGMTGDMTVYGLVNATNFSAARGIFAKTGGGANNIPNPYDTNLGTTGPGRIEHLRGNGAWFNAYVSSANVTAGQWSNVVATSNAGNTASTGYIDATSTTMTGGTYGGTPGQAISNDTTKAALIGNRTDGATQFYGYIAVVAIWDRVLDAGEVQMLTLSPFCMLIPVLDDPLVMVASGGPTNITLTQQAVTWTGNVPTVNQKQAITATQKAVTWTGNVPTVNQKQAITATQQAVTWTGGVPAINQKQQVTATQASWQWTANAVSTSSATMVTLTQAVVTWAGQAPAISYIQRITAAAVSWVWRGVTGPSSGGGIVAGLLSGVLRGVIRRRDPRDPDPPL